jgi:integrase
MDPGRETFRRHLAIAESPEAGSSVFKHHLTRGGLHKVWLEVCARAGVEDLNIHDFRSLAASEAEAQGLGPKTGAAILGHKDIRTTLKRYTRARKTREAAAKP